jgi:hypothetical protein
VSVFLLVEVAEDEASQVEAFIGSTGGVESVAVHNEGPGFACCCKNCPWGGDHG